MAIKRVSYRVCDVCNDERLITDSFRLADGDSRLRTIDLCDAHAEPIRRILDPKFKPLKEARRRAMLDPA